MAPTADSFLLVIPGLGSCGPGCCRWMYALTEPQQKALSQALGLHTAGCRLPAPQSLLTLVSGPPLPPLPPFPPSTFRKIHQGSDTGAEAAAAEGARVRGQASLERCCDADEGTRGRQLLHLKFGGQETYGHRIIMPVTWAGSFEGSQERGPRGNTAHS